MNNIADSKRTPDILFLNMLTAEWRAHRAIISAVALQQSGLQHAAAMADIIRLKKLTNVIRLNWNGGWKLGVMKKVLLFFLYLILLIASSMFDTDTDGVRNGDWTYVLPNEYEIWHINSETIVFGKRDGKHSLAPVVNSYISEFCCDGSFVALKRKASRECAAEASEFYLVDTGNGTVLGPMTEESFLQESEAKEFFRMPVWIKTYPRPEGSVFK